jgi:zinc protease
MFERIRFPRVTKAAFAAAALAVATGVAQAGPKIQHWVAPSGARVYFVETQALPILDVQVDFPAGGAHSAPEKAGVAGLTASLIDQGAGGVSEHQIAERLADLGAMLGNSAGLDRASVSLRTLSDPAMRDKAIEIMATVMASPDYPAAVVERERERAVVGLKDALTRPDALAGRAFQTALYGDHPYARQPTPETLGKLTRDDLVAFHKANYVASRAAVTLIGAISRAEAEKIAQQLTERLPKGAGAKAVPPVDVKAGPTVKIDHHAQQAHVHMGMPAIKRGDPDFFALQLGNYTLGGGGFVSRLVKEVRDKRGFAYSVYSYFQPSQELGPFQIGLQTKRAQAKEALDVVRSVLDEFLRDGPTEEELKAAKANLIGGFALNLDSNKKLMTQVSAIGFYGLPLDWLDQYTDRLSKVKVADVKAAFARHVKADQLAVVTVAAD